MGWVTKKACQAVVSETLPNLKLRVPYIACQTRKAHRYSHGSLPSTGTLVTLCRRYPVIGNDDPSSGQENQPQPPCACKADLDQTCLSSNQRADHEQIVPPICAGHGLLMRDSRRGIDNNVRRNGLRSCGACMFWTVL
jgi:hypothetical protein